MGNICSRVYAASLSEGDRVHDRVHDEVHVEECGDSLNVEENILKVCKIARSRAGVWHSGHARTESENIWQG